MRRSTSRRVDELPPLRREKNEPSSASLPLGNWFEQSLLTREAFCVHITFPYNHLRKFKCHSVPVPIFTYFHYFHFFPIFLRGRPARPARPPGRADPAAPPQ